MPVAEATIASLPVVTADLLPTAMLVKRLAETMVGLLYWATAALFATTGALVLTVPSCVDTAVTCASPAVLAVPALVFSVASCDWAAATVVL